MNNVPPIVEEALALASDMKFESSCSPEVGRLLRVLAGFVRAGVIGEIGSGCGVGTAWLADGMTTGAKLVTVEKDETRASAVRRLFAGMHGVEVLHGDWHHLLEYGPFDLLFVDAAQAKHDEPDLPVRSLKPGGLLLLDDLTPEDLWSTELRELLGKGDRVREFWLNDPRLTATEVLVTPSMSVILAVRRE